MRRLYDRLLDGLALLAVLLIFAIMLGVGVDVGLRFLFRSPIGWMLEFTEYALLLILFFGMAWLVRERGHVAIELIVDLVPASAARTMRIFATVAAGLTSGLLSYWAVVTTIDNYQRGVETFGIYPIPRFILFAVVALGFTLTTIEFARWVVAQVTGAERDGRGERGVPVADQIDLPK